MIKPNKILKSLIVPFDSPNDRSEDELIKRVKYASLSIFFLYLIGFALIGFGSLMHILFENRWGYTLFLLGTPLLTTAWQFEAIRELLIRYCQKFADQESKEVFKKGILSQNIRILINVICVLLSFLLLIDILIGV